jgi:hypothetical protein
MYKMLSRACKGLESYIRAWSVGGPVPVCPVIMRLGDELAIQRGQEYGTNEVELAPFRTS